MKFSDYQISPAIKEQLDVLGFKRPTDIQFKTIMHVINGEDVMAIAQTGTGKTAAFVIPTLERIIQQNKKQRKGISCLVMVPTRELAEQIQKVYTDIGKKTGVKAECIFGGVDQDAQKEALSKSVDVLVTTPGRMFDLIAQKSLDITNVRTLILDEADLMLDMGFYKDIEDVMRHLPKKHQTLFFSATISKKIKKMAYNIVSSNAIRIQISPKNPVAKNVEHSIVYVEMDDKRFFLENTLREYPESKVLVFARTQVRVERIVKAMERVQIHSEALHGGLEQKERFQILENFRGGKTLVLITTDVAARGIDIPNVDYVINYDVPDNPENYVHRCGRTGRGKEYGQAITFCSNDEKPLVDAIEEYTGDKIERYSLSNAEYQEIIRDSDDGSNDWQALIREANKEDKSEDIW